MKEGRRREQFTGNTTTKSKSCPNHHREKTTGIVGTSAGGNIQVMKTKLVCVFATKFLDSETLANYLKDKLRLDVTCQKIDTAQTRFNSFKITAEWNEVSKMYEPQIWPEGTFVKRFYEVRKPRSTAAPVDIKAPVATTNVSVARASFAL